MAKCKNDVLLNMITTKQLSKNTAVYFSVLDELPDCKKIMANAYVDVVGRTSYNSHKRPTNRFECDAYGCLTGTLYFGPEGEEGQEVNGSATYKAQYDATEFANGAITFYVAPTEDNGSVKVTIGDKADLANTDVYEFAYTADMITDDGFVPVIIDLTAAPTEVIGEGWVASKSGAYIKIESDKAIGLSSISVFDDINDFAVTDVISGSCLSTIEGSDDIDALESACLRGGYDTSTDTPIERTITARMLTPNYWKLNPRGAKGDKTEGFVQTTISATVVDDGTGEHGMVVLADMAENCGWLTAQISDACNVTESGLELLSVPTMVQTDAGHFLALKGEDGATNLVFHKDLIGMEVLISYPKKAAVQNHSVYSMDNVGSRRVRITFVTETSDGVKDVFVANDVLMTSFPMSITEEETEFSFTIAIQRDANGINYERYQIVA